jgi:hypothetical protein
MVWIFLRIVARASKNLEESSIGDETSKQDSTVRKSVKCSLKEMNFQIWRRRFFRIEDGECKMR